MNEEHVGIVRVSLKNFYHMLDLPEGWKVRGVAVADFGRDLKLIVEGPDIPAVPEGCDVSQVADIQVQREMKYDDNTDQWWYRTELHIVPRT